MLVNGVKLRRWWFVTFCFSFFFSRSPGWSTISGSCFSTKGRGNDACDVGTDIFLPIIMQEFTWCLRRMHQFFFFFLFKLFFQAIEREREKMPIFPLCKTVSKHNFVFCFFQISAFHFQTVYFSPNSSFSFVLSSSSCGVQRIPAASDPLHKHPCIQQ